MSTVQVSSAAVPSQIYFQKKNVAFVTIRLLMSATSESMWQCGIHVEFITLMRQIPI